MGFGSSFDSVWNRAGDQAKQAAATVAAGSNWVGKLSKSVADRVIQDGKQAKEWVERQSERIARKAGNAAKAVQSQSKRIARKAVSVYEKAEDAATEAMAGATTAVCNVYRRGRSSARARNAEPASGLPVDIRGGVQREYDGRSYGRYGDSKHSDDKPLSDSIFAEVSNKTLKEDLLYYGNDQHNIRIGHGEATFQTGYEYDREKKEHNVSVIKVEAAAAAVQAEASGSAARGLWEGKVMGEALAAKAEAEISAKFSEGFKEAELRANLGGELILAKASASGQVNITPKTIYDNTLGALVGHFKPESEYAHAADWIDHGIILGAEGEVGVAAAAEAEAGIVKDARGTRIECGAKLGAGPMAGLKFFAGIK